MSGLSYNNPILGTGVVHDLPHCITFCALLSDSLTVYFLTLSPDLTSEKTTNRASSALIVTRAETV